MGHAMSFRTRLVASFCIPFLAFACSTSSDADLYGGDGDENAGLPSADGARGGPIGAAGDGSGPVPPSTGPTTQTTAGLLTAGAWDDNENFERWEAFRNQPSARAFALPLSLQEQQTANLFWMKPAAPKQSIEISLLLDTTGSMSDELSYLTSEFSAIAAAVQTKYPNAAQRWSLVVYRDAEEEYLVRSFDFDADVSTFQRHLREQSASAGGDMPEAAHAGLMAMNALQWSTDASVAKLAFWLTDAPPHDQDLEQVASEFRASKALGVHLYPVASSGADLLTEYVLRAGAQLTGGRFLFLTDDSGVGKAHTEPKVPCYWVTKLNDAILRVVDHELTGAHRAPSTPEIVREIGAPVSGVCTAADGSVSSAY